MCSVSKPFQLRLFLKKKKKVGVLGRHSYGGKSMSNRNNSSKMMSKTYHIVLGDKMKKRDR